MLDPHLFHRFSLRWTICGRQTCHCRCQRRRSCPTSAVSPPIL